ncbi:MAG: hypothetical protein ACJA09_003421 [Alcanivorax sp.]|jgi:hypothetical protein
MLTRDCSKKFRSLGAYREEKAGLTISFDVIYHLSEYSVYFSYMDTIFDSSSKFIIMFSSHSDSKKFGNHQPIKNDNEHSTCSEFYIFVHPEKDDISR